jgi:hypothetical protein
VIGRDAGATAHEIVSALQRATILMGAARSTRRQAHKAPKDQATREQDAQKVTVPFDDVIPF